MSLEALLSAIFVVLQLLATTQASLSAGRPRLSRGFDAWPWLFRASRSADNPRQFRYDSLYPYYEKFSQSDFERLAQTGADFVRIQVELGPLVFGDEQGLKIATDGIIRAVKRLERSHLNTIVTLTPHEFVQGLSTVDFLSKPDVRARLTAAMVYVASRLRAEPTAALEILNEPSIGWKRTRPDWTEMQAAFVKAVRGVAPQMTLVVTGDLGGGIKGLVRLDPAGLDDANILYSFHYYDPMAFTHQGAAWGANKTREFLAGVPFPPQASAEDAVVERYRDAVQASSLPDVEKASVAREGTSAIDDYFRSDPGQIGNDISEVANWADVHRIPHDRVILGEFGVLHPTAPLPSATEWIRQVRTAAERQGFSWCFHNFDPTDFDSPSFNIFTPARMQPRSFEPSILVRGLGLRLP